MDKSKEYISIIQIFENLAEELRGKCLSPVSGDDIVTKAANATFEYCAELVEVRIRAIKYFTKINDGADIKSRSGDG